MSAARPLLALGVCAALAAATGVAAAAPKAKPVCNLVTDAAGDASVVTGDDAMDVLAVDVASDKANITGVVRVKKLATSSANAPTGMNWTVNFTAEEVDFSLAGHVTAAGSVIFDTAYAGATGGSIYGPGTTGVFDTAKNEVRITAPLSLLGEQATIRAGKTKITNIGGTAGPELLVPDASGLFGSTLLSYSPLSADDTEGGKDYTAGTASCVPVGK